MKQKMQKILKTLTYNIKTLLYFEIIYRLVGVLIIFPVARLLFLLSIRWSGYVYITNRMLLDYLFKPSTIMILFLLVILLSFYLVIEMTFLSILFDFSYHEEELRIKKLFFIGIKKVFFNIRKYHIVIIFPAFLLFIIVELLHFVGIIATISLPELIIEEINNMPVLRVISIGLVVVAIVLFIETLFYINLFTIENKSIRIAYKESNKLLRNRRFKMLFEFGLMNAFLNAILYVFYLLIIAIISFLIYITRGQELVLALLLTTIYTIYVVIGFLGTIILIPINYALVTCWYYDGKEKLGQKIINEHKQYRKSYNFKWFKRGLLVALIILFILNITSVLTVVRQSKVHVELFKYPEIIAHRGASYDAPENTLAAIEIAIIQGADVVEIDVRETKDLVPILMHDPTLGRTTNDINNRGVHLVDLNYIKALDAGSWFSSDYIGEEVPTLAEVFELVDGRVKLYIELKSSSQTLTDNVINLIEEYNMVDKVKIMSFNNIQLRNIKNSNPDIQTIFLIVTFYGDINGLLNSDYIDHVAFESKLISNNPHYVQSFQQSYKKIYVWTVNSEEKIRAMVESDVDGIITDRPILAREVAYSKNKQSVFSDLLKELFSKR